MHQSFIDEYIPKISSVEDIYNFFKQLGYTTLTTNYKTNLSSFGLRAKDKEYVEDIYVVSNYDKKFQIYFIKLKSISNEIVHSLSDLFLKTTHFPFLVLSSDFTNFSFVMVEKIRKDIGEFKQKIIKLNIDKNNLYHTDAEVLTNIKLDGEIKPEDIYKKLTDAFSVEKVTGKFFKDYIQTFKTVKEYFLKQDEDIKSVHDFTQQLLNRIMFIYFVAKKRWLGNDLKFMSSFWDMYCKGKKKGDYKQDTFYNDWLSVLFFEAFNNKFFPRKYFSDELNNILMLAPYLNGGLFTRNKLDDKGFSISDSVFENIFTFLNRYNFTIREELPLEKEIAVDPEMIGRVYESLVNLTEDTDERGEAGIFYTDRIEIDFMCRRSLVEYFYNHLQSEVVSKELIYKFIFSKTDNEKQEIEKELNKLKIWEKTEKSLDALSILDLACGSGSFLVGMLNVLTELYKLTYKNLNRLIDDFEIKKQIIGRSLYGVDVMEWACHVAELRLWLQLIVESELSLGEIKTKPLLPNLTFKIKHGDSLVQEIGNINLAFRNNRDISSSLKRKLTELKQEKLKFYYNDPSGKFRSERLLLQEELNIFRAILNERILNLDNKIKDKEKSLSDKEGQLFFKGSNIKETIQQEFKFTKQIEENIKKEIEQLHQDREYLFKILSTLNKDTKPFVWDIDFVEIFSDEFEAGFDIVIGNPPYVRQEKISDPKLSKEEITNENKREYKDKLIKSIQNHFPFIKNMDKRSDLYIYFYFQGLALLNQSGVFCFITSNSWLDVGYGRVLQEFLLENVKIYAIYDNSAKRSFARADINTIIAIFSAPVKNKEVAAGFSLRDNLAKFVMFKKPFDDILTLNNLLKIEKAKEITKTDDFRVYPKKQIELLEEGWEYPETDESVIARSKVTKQSEMSLPKFLTGKYEGNKWGGKYLKAPDIFFTILERGKDKLISLGTITKFAGYIHDNNISDKFPKTKIILSSQFINKITIDKTNNIVWRGIKKDGNSRLIPDIVVPRTYSEQFLVIRNIDKILFKRFYKITINNKIYIDNVCLSMNSTLQILFWEYIGIAEGLGALNVYKDDFGEILIIDPKMLVFPIEEFKSFMNREIKSIFEECGFNARLPIREQEPNPLPDRKELDDIIFDILGLTKAERNEVYWSVCELVQNRLSKAKSV